MEKNKIAFTLSVIASLICFSNFTYKLIYLAKIDYFILIIGIFIIALGVSTYVKKKQ